MSNTITCTKCKQIVSANEIRCPHCGMRLHVICSKCGTINDFGQEHCSKCSSELLKYCQVCGSANVPNEHACRKCLSPLKTYLSREQILLMQQRIVMKKEQVNPALYKIIYQRMQKNLEAVEQQVEIEKQKAVHEEISQQAQDSNEYIKETTDKSQNVEIKENQEIQQTTNEEVAEQQNIKNDQSYEEQYAEQTENPEREEQEYEETVIPDEKLGMQLKDNELEDDYGNEFISFDNTASLSDQLANVIQTENNAVIIGICGKEGVGKTSVLKMFSEQLGTKGIIPVYANCYESLTESPYGSIRDAILKLLTLPDLHPSVKDFYSEQTKQLFVQNFETLNEQEILLFMNFLYPSLKSTIAEIDANKEKIENLLEKIFQSILSKNNAIFAIDNFDKIDTGSFDFIQRLINNGIINNKTKLFITYSAKLSPRKYFDIEISDKDIFVTLFLEKINDTEMMNLVQGMTNTLNIPEQVMSVIKQQGNIAITEQYLSALYDTGYMYIGTNEMVFKDEPCPVSFTGFEDLIETRLNLIQDEEAKITLYVASSLGERFNALILSQIGGIEENRFEEIMNLLVSSLFIQKENDYEYAFKNETIWKVILKQVLANNNFRPILDKMYNGLSLYANSNPVLKAKIAEYKLDKEGCLKSWENAAGISAYLGDNQGYANALEKILLLTGYNKTAAPNEQQIELLENIGKLKYKTSPNTAIEYLTPPIMQAKEANNAAKMIELGGFIIKACYEKEDFYGVVETADLILSAAKDRISPLEAAIIKSKKLTALLKTGLCEEGINLAVNEIIPTVEESLANENDESTAQKLLEVWVDSSIELIKLYALQGNSKSIEIADNTFEILKNNNIENPDYNIRLSIAKSFALCVKGCVTDSIMLIREVEKNPEYNKKRYINDRNLIFCLNMALCNYTDGLNDSLFKYAKFAKDINTQFEKHIFKLIFAWLTYFEGNHLKASIMFNDELTHFAEEKIVTGALLSWLFIAKTTFETKGAESAEHIAAKALEIAQNPKFLQYHTAVYLHKIIAETNILKGDLNTAKIHLEKGMTISKQFGLDLAQVELYRTYAKFLVRTIMPAEESSRTEIAVKTSKIYQVAMITAEKIKVPGLSVQIQEEIKSFNEFCKGNNIIIPEQ